MTENIAPIARIMARYISGVLVTYGFVSPEDAAILNPEIVAIAGLMIGLATEGVYAFAKRKGWAT
jgi:hypothetical protein